MVWRTHHKRFPKRSRVVSLIDEHWSFLLNRLTHRPSVRFTNCAPSYAGHARLLEDGRETMMSHQKASLSYGARREVLAQIAPRYQQTTGAQKMLL